MEKLYLLPGPRLLRTACTLASDSPGAQWSTRDVTKQANEYLFKPVEIGEGVTLTDIFGLLIDDPVMQLVFRQCFVTELCAEVVKGAIRKNEPSPEQIEYLELYQHWSFDSHTKAYSSVGRYMVHGIGPELVADVNVENWLMYKKGTRIQWSISMSPVRELLHLPVRLKEQVSVSEDDLDARNYGQEVSQGLNRTITLGTLIRELLWEMSWHGAPEETLKISEELKEQVDEIKAGTVETVPFESVFESLGYPSDATVYATVFEISGSVETKEIISVLRDLDDTESAALGLSRIFSETVSLKPEFEALSGRELRSHIRELRYAKI